jgi:pyrroloquinoline quinone biosynthesis protein B
MSNPHVFVLGVAQDGGHPQPGCTRSCCAGADVVPHLTTCVAIVDDGHGWILDAGPDFRQHLALLDRAGVELAGILLTHGHIGHYTGLMYLGREAMDAASMPVWAAPRLAGYLRSNGPWEQLVGNGNIDLRTIDTTASIRLTERVKVMAFAVPHRDEYSETVGFKISGPSASVLYVPDTDGWGEWDPPVEGHIAGSDIALLDATFFDGTELPNRNTKEIAHPLVVDSLARFSPLPDDERAKIRFTHLNHSNPLLDRNSDASIRVARAGMAVAAEGDVYEL